MKSIRKEVTGSALRGETVDEMIYTYTCPMISVIDQSVWDCKGI